MYCDAAAACFRQSDRNDDILDRQCNAHSSLSQVLPQCRVQVRIGERHQVERNTSISMCQQLQQSASLSDDELEYAAESAPSPPSEAAAPDVSANGKSSRQMDAPSADGHGQLPRYDVQLTYSS